jgi:HEPN domain-containing protein
VTRSELQKLARTHLRAARLLLSSGEASAAYYLAGLCVECGIKAAIARKTLRYDFPDLRTVKQSWDHNLSALIKAAGLAAQLDSALAADQSFARNWAVVKDWENEARYRQIALTQATDMYRALTQQRHGVMKWIRANW